MNSEEIKQEARKRIEQMSEEQKRAALGITDEEQRLLDNAKGYWDMTKQEQAKFQTAFLKELDGSHAGGLDQGGFERDLLDDYGITRDDIKNGAKNPFKKEMLKIFLIMLALNIGAAVFAVLKIKEGVFACEGPTGILALYFARLVMQYFKFKKLQKKYVSGEFTHEEIKAEVYRQLLEERKAKNKTV